MSSSARIFLAVVLTSILALGFGGGLMLAQSAIKQPSDYQIRAGSGQAPAVRVILPALSEPALQASSAVRTSQVQTQPEKDVLVPFEKQVESAGDLKTSVAAEERRERRRRYAGQKSKKMVARAKQQTEQKRQRSEPGIMAFGGDDSRSGISEIVGC